MKQLIENILNDLPHGKIGVLGDFCVDVYWDIAPEQGEKSIETGRTTIPVTCARYSPGGAGNIVANLRGIGVENIHCFGLYGSDPFGIWMNGALASQNATQLIRVERADYHTPVYCKPLLQEIEQSRFDLGNTPVADEEAVQVINSLRRAASELKVLIINSQLANGLHSAFFRKLLKEFMDEFQNTVTFVFDGRDFLDAYPLAILKINADAASNFAFGKGGVIPEISGREILKRNNFVPLVITDGRKGCTVFEKNGETAIPAVPVHGKIDTVGAGDSHVSGFSCALACQKSIVEAAIFGNCCSSVTIRKINQTGVPYPHELRQLLENN